MIISIYISLVESYLLDVMCDVIGGKIENEVLDFLFYNNLLKIVKWEIDENIILGRFYVVYI